MTERFKEYKRKLRWRGTMRKNAGGMDPEQWKPEGWNYNTRFWVEADGQPETGFEHDTVEDAQNEAAEIRLSAPDSTIEIVGDNGYRRPYPGDLYGYKQ